MRTAAICRISYSASQLPVVPGPSVSRYTEHALPCTSSSRSSTFEARLYRSPYTITHARTYALTYILIFALIFDLTHARISALTLISAPTHVLAGVLRLILHRAC